MTDNVIRIFGGEIKSANLFDAIEEIVFEKGEGMPITSILGVLELVKDSVKDSVK